MLDHLATLRHIWPGHMSNAPPSVWECEDGMVRVHKWLKTLEPQATCQPGSSSSGDKPGSSVLLTPAPKVMPKMPGKEALDRPLKGFSKAIERPFKSSFRIVKSPLKGFWKTFERAVEGL